MASHDEQPNVLTRTLERVKNALAQPQERPSVLRQVIHMLRVAAIGVQRTNLTRMAAALSYRTIFGLVPVLVVSLVVLTAMASEDAVKVGLKQMLHFAGLDQVTVPVEGGSDGVSTATDAVPITPDAWIKERAQALKSAPSGVFAIIGVAMLVYAALSMLVEIEKSFNSVCGAPTGRRWARRITLYWTLLTLGTLLLVGGFFLTEQATASVARLSLRGGVSAWIGSLSQIALYFSSLAISTILFCIMYTAVPNTRVKLGPALLGAVIAASCWELGKRGFTAYAGYATKNLHQMYGAVAILPLLMLWIYLTWIIVLMGLQIAHSVQTYRQAATQGLTKSVLASLGLIDGKAAMDGPKVVDPASILTLAVGIAARFRDGALADAGDLAEAAGMEERTATDMIERLTNAGIVHRVVAEGEEQYTLARPAETISAVEVLRVGDELSEAKGRKERPGYLEEMLRARNVALAGKTLADLLPGKAGVVAAVSAV